MRIIGLTALALSLTLVSAPRLGAQQFDSAHREVWQTVEARWRAWQAGDLEKMVALYHPRFHAWNRVSGRLDAHDALLARWRDALQSERILDVKLEPIAVELYGEFAAAFYVSRETVKQISATARTDAGSAAGAEPTVVTIRWSDYLVKDGGRWLFIGYGGSPCSQSEPAGSPCRSFDKK
jgi:hypothetical protein